MCLELTRRLLLTINLCSPYTIHQASPNNLVSTDIEPNYLTILYNIYEPGKDTPCDYGSRHPPNRNQFTEEEVEDWCIEADTDVYVNCVIEKTLPQAITKDVLREASKKGKEMRALMEDISLHNECCQDFLKPYRGVFNEMWTIDGIALKGSQAVLPVFLRANAIGLKYEGHQCADKTLRQTCWFPGMRKQVQDFVVSCLPCNAAQPHAHPVPLQPNFLPDRTLKGPLGESATYMLQGRTGMYTLVVPSLSTKFIKNSHQNLLV